MRRLSTISLAVGLTLVAATCSSESSDSATATDSESSTSTSTSTTSTSTTASTTTTTTTTTIPGPEASTVDELLALDRPVSIAHAGGDQAYPHSTMFAYKEAAKAGVDVLEMDVQLTADGVLIVQHDATLDKTTETTGPVIDRTLAELQALDNAYWFAPAQWPNHDLPVESYIYRGVRTGAVEPPEGYTADDFAITTFEAVSTAFPDHVLDIEIKFTEVADGTAVASALAQALVDLNRTESAIVTSFSEELMVEFRKSSPSVVTSPGQDALLAWYLADTPFQPSDRIVQIPPFYEGQLIIEPITVGRAHDAGLEIWAWMDDAATQENADYYQTLLDLQIDGIIAGQPAALVALLD